jgi:hypothetical protein
MDSKLFHSIIAVGIQLGIATGCGGSTQSSSSGTVDVDGSTADAGADAVAIGQAFCDVPWPTTKGTAGQAAPACANEAKACTDADMHVQGACIAVGADACVDYSKQLYPNCRAGKWVCKPGTESRSASGLQSDPPLGAACSCDGSPRGRAICKASPTGALVWQLQP